MYSILLLMFLLMADFMNLMDCNQDRLIMENVSKKHGLLRLRLRFKTGSNSLHSQR